MSVRAEPEFGRIGGNSCFRGKPGFIIGGFGGATAGVMQEHEGVFERLRNGLPREENEAIASSTDVDRLVKAIIAQLRLLPLRSKGKTSPGDAFFEFWL